MPRLQRARGWSVVLARVGVAGLALVGAGSIARAVFVDQRPLTVPHGPLSSFAWTDLPEFGGSEAIIYRSPDGRRVAAAFRESGRHRFTYPFDEFLVVTSGSATFRVEGGPTFSLDTGDVAYFRKGMVVEMNFSNDFSDVTMLVGDEPVRWR